MGDPLVSVCIGTYNRERFIRECLDSVYSQTYKNIEVIVVDDCSTDKTVEIVQTYKPTILIQLDKNSGICSLTRNKAAAHAKGEFIAFLDSDDAWYPEKIEIQVDRMTKNPLHPLSHTYCQLIDEESRPLGIRHEGKLPPTGNVFLALLDHCWITMSSVMIRKELYEKLGGFLEHPHYGVSGEDWDFFLRASRSFEFYLISAVLTKYRVSLFSVNEKRWRDKPNAVPYMKYFVKNSELWVDKVPRKRVVNVFLNACMENSIYWRDRDYFFRSLWFCAQGLSINFFSPSMWLEFLKSVTKYVLSLCSGVKKSFYKGFCIGLRMLC